MNEYFDENTHFKVRSALLKAGLTEQQVLDAINEMQNAGILFRERMPMSASRNPVMISEGGRTTEYRHIDSLGWCF